MAVFTPEHHAFRRLVREFVEQEINPHVEQWEADGMMPLHEDHNRGFAGWGNPGQCLALTRSMFLRGNGTAGSKPCRTVLRALLGRLLLWLGILRPQQRSCAH